MSDLKHLSYEKLLEEKHYAEGRLRKLQSQVAGQQEKIKWIDHYIKQAETAILTKNYSRLKD